MKFSTFPFGYDPQNPVQQNDFPVFDNSLEAMFSDQLREIRDEEVLGVMQNMINDNITAHGQAQDQQPVQPPSQPDLEESLRAQDQHTHLDFSYQGGVQVEKPVEAGMPSQQVSQMDPQVHEVVAQPQLQVPLQPVLQQVQPTLQQQQMLQPEPLAVQNKLQHQTEQLQAEVRELRSQLKEAKKTPQHTKKHTPPLRLRMRLRPNAQQQTQMGTNQSGKVQLQQQQPIQIREASKDPLNDLFGPSPIPIPSAIPRMPQPHESQFQSEQVPFKDDLITHLPFWQVGNPSDVPSFNFLPPPEVDRTNNPLAVIDTNLFAGEINDGAFEANFASSRLARKAKMVGDKGDKGNALVHAIARPSDVTRANALNNNFMVDEITLNVPLNGEKQQKTQRRRKVQPNEQESRKRRRVALSTSSIYNDSECDENDGGDPDYVPGEENERSESTMVAPTISDLSTESPREAVSEQEFESGPVTCAKCNDVFANSDSMDRHFRLVHAKPKENMLVCQECQQPCRNKQNLHRHWGNAHSGELKFFCDVCEARFCTKRSLSLHRTKQHPDVYKPRPKRKKTKFHECQLCDYTSDQSYNVVRHFFTKHTDKVAMECLYGCGRTFKSSSNAKVHFFKCKQRPLNRE